MSRLSNTRFDFDFEFRFRLNVFKELSTLIYLCWWQMGFLFDFETRFLFVPRWRVSIV